MLDRTGKTLFVTGPTASLDSRVRANRFLWVWYRARNLRKKLISAKLRGQETRPRQDEERQWRICRWISTEIGER